MVQPAAARLLITKLTRIFGTVSFLSLLSSQAFAQAAQAQPPAYMNIIPFAVIFGVMYFFMIRPQAKRQKAHQEFLTQIKRGDEVLTASGIFGRVEGLTEQFITLEVAPDVRIKILRSQVAGLAQNATAGSTAGARA